MDYRKRNYYLVTFGYDYEAKLEEYLNTIPSLKTGDPYNHFFNSDKPNDVESTKEYSKCPAWQMLFSCRKEYTEMFEEILEKDCGEHNPFGHYYLKLNKEILGQ